jgi:HK97 family phage prohead protease
MKNLPNKDLPVTRRFNVSDLRAAAVGDGSDGRTVEGHAVVYGQTVSIGGWFNEVIERGALDTSDLTDVLFFVNHDTDKIPLARSRRNNGNSTMQLSFDDQGLYFKAQLDTDNNAEAKSLYSAVNRADITGMSFMFRVQDEEWQDLDTDMPTRRVLKISKVYEISAVNSPAYSETDINARDLEALDSAKNALDNARSLLDSNKSELDLLKEKLKLR